MPEQLKLPFGLWTRKAIVELIKRQYNIKIAIHTIGTNLKRWDYERPKIYSFFKAINKKC